MMLNRIWLYLFGAPRVSPEEVYIPSEFLFGNPLPEDYDVNKKVLPSLASGMFGGHQRNPYDHQIPCNMKECERPSCYTITTLEKLDVDIPFASGSRLRGEFKLPTYQEYRICDRHFEKLEVAPILVLGPAHRIETWPPKKVAA